MKSPFRFPIAVLAVLALTLGLKIPQASASPPTQTSAATDREALVALYHATGGDNWKNNSNWLGDRPLISWHGVHTDRYGRVFELDLSDNNLRGTIPSELGNLSSLVVLNLSENQLSGAVPPELGNLSNLELLYLNHNRLSGEIPSELARLKNLHWLIFLSNRLTGPIPLGLAELSNLEWLILADNQLSGPIPPELGNLTNLVWLILGDNQLNGPIPPELGYLTNLRRLGLGNSQLNGPIPPELGNLTDLEMLDLGSNKLSGPIPPELENLANLTYLYLSHSGITGCLPTIWRDVEDNDLDDVNLPFCSDRETLVALYEATDGDNWLQNRNWLSNAPLGTWYGVITDENDRVIGLNLPENELNGELPAALGNLSSLEMINLPENRLRGTIPAALGNLTSLKLLLLYSNQLTGPIPPELGKLANLEQLALLNNRLEGTVPPDLGNLNNLKSLALAGNRLRGTIPPDLGNLANLKYLALNRNGLTGKIPPQLTRLTGLVWVHLANNRLTGCLPALWRNVEENDLDEVGLPFCSDRDALIALYHAAGGDNWTNNHNWLSNEPIDDWHGVVAYKNGRVIGLSLFDNGLKGTIPAELGNLPHLQLLFLAKNQLSGPIPSELGSLANLKLLILAENNLEGPIPPALGNLASLENLSLASNQLSGDIPSELGNLANMNGLNLADNRLSGEIPPELGNLARLTGLDLSDNRLSGAVPSELRNLRHLEILSLAGNRLRGCIPAVWESVERSDILLLDLPFCQPAAPTAAATGQNLTPARIFETVSPAIAFVFTWTGRGSGVLVEGGYIVTNAHVVWPYDSVGVVFPEGTVLRNVPVIGWDLLADLAVLGPVDAPAQPLPMLDGEQIPTGSELFLVGYPAEIEAYPQPTMTRGILSRTREWQPAGITFFQTDAAIAAGQSGGALVSATGAVIGISGFKAFDEFGLAASSADLLPRIHQLIAGRDPAGLGPRQLMLTAGAHNYNLSPQDDGTAYLLHEPPETAVEIQLTGADADDRIQLVDIYGKILADGRTGSISFVTSSSGLYFLVLLQVSNDIALTSSHPLVPLEDPDDGKQLVVGETYRGNIDFPSDIDYLSLDLQQDEKVEIVVRSIMADSQLAVSGYRGENQGVLMVDENSGGGLFGLDARIVLHAPHAGEYDLIVRNEHPRSNAPAGYTISVTRAAATDPQTALRPHAVIISPINVRAGPGTSYPIIGTAAPGDAFPITGKNPAPGDWWQISYEGRTAWVYGPLVAATNAHDVEVVSPP
ncbi:MAG: trypsin-like peptidase domain-containing protein [Caldilineaceae bacterium]|nr:trypsin-like peptidase domain-containing protein [Caldilineaceae bacterium]